MSKQCCLNTAGAVQLLCMMLYYQNVCNNGTCSRDECNVWLCGSITNVPAVSITHIVWTVLFQFNTIGRPDPFV